MKKKSKKKQEEYNEFLIQIKKVFEPRYKEKLKPERVEQIARNLINYACVCHNAYSKSQGKTPMYQV